MSSLAGREVTELLQRWGQGESAAWEELWPLVYQELRSIAHRVMNGERRGHTLQPTALVNEAYLKMSDLKRIRCRSRGHFFAIAARLMRRILVDQARARNAVKRAGGGRITIDLADRADGPPPIDILDLDDALRRFSAMEPEKARIVELKFFGGLTNREAAVLLGCSEKTIQRHWKFSKLWLYRELTGGSNCAD